MLHGIECPPIGNTDRCQLSSSNVCRRPNAWVEWLALKGGRGLSLEQIRQSYYARGKRFKSNRTICQMTKARGKSNELNIPNIGNPVHYYVEQDPLPHGFFHARRRLIVRELRKLWNVPSQQFNVELLTARHVEQVFLLIDRFYFNNTLMPDILLQLNGNIEYHVVDDHREDSSMWYTDHILHNNDRIYRAEFTLNKHVWRDKEVLYVDAIHANNHFEALVLTCEHELAHLMIGVYARQSPGDSKGHGVVFRTLVNRLFGHSENVYIYQSEPGEVI